MCLWEKYFITRKPEMSTLRDLSEISRGEGGGDFKLSVENNVIFPSDGNEIS